MQVKSTSTDPAILVEDVSKVFTLRPGGSGTMKAAVLDLFRGGSARRFEALKDLSFSVKKGETLGIIGVNGAGKSTLLSLIAGTMYPTHGRISVQGSISSLLELGAGFHPDLTGRENVYLYGAIMGIPRQQMKERFAAIVDFAGLADFIDQPVKHYSSGMYVRLGFAVAVEVNPDVLLIDEVLAVGDIGFQRKCLKKIDEFKGQGKTMLIISHDMGTIQGISDRILLLDHGQIAGIGDPGSVVNDYQSRSRKQAASGMEREWGTGEVRITGVTFRDRDGKPSETFKWGESLEAEIAYSASRKIEGPVFGFSVSDEAGRLIYGNNTQIEGVAVPFVEGEGCLKLLLKNLNMATGTYLFSFSVHSEDHRTNYHRLDHAFPVAVVADKSFEGCTYLETDWSVAGSR